MSVLEINPIWLEEPIIWRKFKWIIEKIRITKGKIKCKEKNRFKVELFTEYPPQTQTVIFEPIKGIEDKILVITVAPQKDICPQGKT